MATKTNWQELYQNLSPSLAEKLRGSRIKPEKLKEMSDGEILSIQNIGESALGKIRELYPIVSLEQTKESGKKSEKEEPGEKKSLSKKTKKATVSVKPKKISSKRYQSQKKEIKSNKLYPLNEAVELLSKLTKKRKTNTLELHINTLDTGIKGEVSLPHSTGKKQTIEIFSDETIVKINSGKLDFTVLLASPSDMPMLAKYAKVLGPKGLMPSPKNGNLIENPEKRLQELSKGSTLSYKTEPKFPIIHLTLGPTTQKSDALVDNIKALIKHINPVKVKSLFLTSTQTPSIMIDLSTI